MIPTIGHVAVLVGALAQFVDAEADALREADSFVWWLEAVGR